MCSLLPGVPDLSETITVRSIVGRFLEHSRVYWCHNHGEPQVYLSSADVMERNLDRRVEIMFPVIDPALATRIRDEELNLGLADTAKARQLLPDRAYQRVDTEPRVNSQIDMLRRTAAQTAT